MAKPSLLSFYNNHKPLGEFNINTNPESAVFNYLRKQN